MNLNASHWVKCISCLPTKLWIPWRADICLKWFCTPSVHTTGSSQCLTNSSTSLWKQGLSNLIFLYCKHNVWYKCNSVGGKVEGWWNGCRYLKSSLPTYKAKQNCQGHVRCAAKPQAESHGYCFCYCMTTFFLLLESNFFEGPAVWYCCSFPKDRKTFSCK